MPYRFELSPNNRAGCQTKECKDNKVKITVGTLRVGTWIDTERMQHWAWRHWGCTTPRVLSNIKNSIQDEEDEDKLDFEALDGFDDLPAEIQEKVKTAIEKGHIEDEEWNGDVVQNRPGMTGMFPRKPRAKTASPEKKKKDASTPAEDDKTEANGGAQAEDEAKGDTPAKAKGKANSKANGKSKGKVEAETPDEAPTEAKKPAAKRKKPARADAPADDDEKDGEDQLPPKRKRATRAKKEVLEEESDVTSKVEKAGRAAKGSKAKGAAKKTAPKEDTEKTVANMGKPKRGRPKTAEKGGDEGEIPQEST